MNSSVASVITWYLRGTFDPVVLPFEGDALVIGCDQAAVGDGNAVGIAGEVTQDFLRAAERVLAINHPVAVAQWVQIGGEGFALGELACLPKNCSSPAACAAASLSRSNRRNKPERTSTGKR